MNRALGAIPSGLDYRDAYAASLTPPAVQLPDFYSTKLDAPMDQNRIPACVSHSIVDLIKLYWWRRTARWIDFSPRFLDILSAEADIPLDGGRRPRTVLKVAASKGCATEATLPSNTALSMAAYRDPAVITQAVADEAAQYAIPGYIGVEIGRARDGIYLYGAVSSLMLVGNEMYTPSWADKDIDPLRTPANVLSGHQMTPYGWGPDLNLIQNEWGTDWADGGRNRYDEEEWTPFTLEQWAVADIPSHLAAFLKELPSPSRFKYQWRRDLRRGGDGQDVKFAQVALMILGFLAPVPPEQLGFYGPKTSKAVEAYQIARGIRNPSGDNIGPLTRARLNADFAL